MFLLLIRVRLLSVWNVARHAAARHRLITVGLSVLGLGIFAALYAAFRFFLSLVPSSAGLHEMVYELFYFLFLFLLAGSVPFVASTLLHSADYQLLSAAPIRPHTIVAAKVLDATVANSLQFSVIGLPAILASVAALSLPLAGWALVIPMIALFVLLPVLITSLALLVALALFGARRVRRVISIVNAVMAAVVCLTIATQTSRMQLHTGIRGGLETAASRSTPAVRRGPASPFAASLIAAGAGQTAQSARKIGDLGLLVAALYGLVVLMGGRLLTAVNLSQEADAEAGPLPQPVRTGSYRRGLLRLFPAPVAAIVAKDLRYVLRDSVLLSQLGMPTILFFVPVILSLQQASERTFHSLPEIYPFAAAMTGVIVFMQTSIISLSSLGIEGRSFWQALSSPNSGLRVLWAKFLLSVQISAGIGMSLILLSAFLFRAPLGSALLHAAIVGACAAGLCGLGVGISATFPRFAYDNPAHRVSTWALILGFLASIVYLIISGTVLLIAWTGLGLSDPRPIQVIGALLFLLVTLICIAAPLTIGARRLETYQWEH